MKNTSASQSHRSSLWHRVAGVAGSVGIALVFGGYWFLFFGSRLPSLEARLPPEVPVREIRRIDLLIQLLLLPEEWLGEAWFGRPMGFAVGDRVPILCWAALIGGTAWAAGWLVLKGFGLSERVSCLERHCFSFAVGANLVSTYTLSVGLAGLLQYPLLFWGPVCAILVGAGWANRNCLKHAVFLVLSKFLNCLNFLKSESILKSQPSGLPGKTSSFHLPKKPSSTWSPQVWPSPGSVWWILAIGPLVVVLLLGAMLPPVDFDVREYHLQAPKEWYQKGRIDFMPHNVYANMPLGAEMLPLAAMALSGRWWIGALAGKTLMASFTLVTAGGLWAIGRQVFSPQAGLAAAALYLATPWILQVSTAGLNEGVTACYGLLGLWAVWLGATTHPDQNPLGESSASFSLGSPSLPKNPFSGALPANPGQSPSPPPSKKPPSVWQSLLLAGYLVGAAAATKYPAPLFIGLPALGWVAWRARQAQSRQTVLKVGVFVLAALLGGGLWYVKNAWLAGNPVYPLFYSVLGGKAWDSQKEARWNRVHFPSHWNLPQLAHDLSRVAWRSEWLGPVLVPLAILGLLRRCPPRKGPSTFVQGLPWALGGYLLWWVGMWWLLTHRIDRFWLPVLPMATLLAGAGFCWSEAQLWRLLRTGLMTVGVVYGFLVGSGVPAAGGYNRYFVPLERLRRDPERVDPWHLWLNQHATKGRVLLVGDAQPFDLEIPVLYATCFNTSPLEEILWEAAARTKIATRPLCLGSKGRAEKEPACSPEKVPRQWLEQDFARAVKELLWEREIEYIFVHWGEIARYRSPGNYGFTPLVQPELFHAWVRWKVLEPLPPLENHPGRCYRLRP